MRYLIVSIASISPLRQLSDSIFSQSKVFKLSVSYLYGRTINLHANTPTYIQNKKVQKILITAIKCDALWQLPLNLF